MLETIRHDAVVELRLARPPVNALDPHLVAALRSAIDAAPSQAARAIVMSGRPGMYSGGLDVPALLQLDQATLKQFLRDFFELCGAIACSPIPIVAAITGHSPAGGAVLSIFCDYRVMARSVDPAKPFCIGLNEVQVGLSVPALIQSGLKRLVGAHRAERLMVAGTMLEGEEALRIGFIDELVDVDQVVPHALDWLQNLLNLPPQAMSTTRRLARRDLTETFADPRTWLLDDFSAAWFSDETQSVLKTLVARLKKT
ncbi:MAG TPA: enoyl-CoA hydratase/isomerase family protein [Rudaea sp.]|jgi:enoyl-CoA hydratase/carnithine racemase